MANTARLNEIVVEYERIFRERTPARTPRHVLARQRVNMTDLLDYAPDLKHTDRAALARMLKPVLARLRKEFPNERWD